MTKLEKLRRERHLTKRGLAAKANVSDNLIYRIETGQCVSGVQIGSLSKLAKALGVPITDVIEDQFL